MRKRITKVQLKKIKGFTKSDGIKRHREQVIVKGNNEDLCRTRGRKRRVSRMHAKPNVPVPMRNNESLKGVQCCDTFTAEVVKCRAELLGYISNNIRKKE